MQKIYDQLVHCLSEARHLQASLDGDGGREIALAITNLQQSIMWMKEYSAEVGDFLIE